MCCNNRFARLHHICNIFSSNTLSFFLFCYFSQRHTFYFIFPPWIKTLCHMASIQKACRAKWLWCLHDSSSTGRNTYTPVAFCLDWHWNKEHIAGGGPPEQKEKKTWCKPLWPTGSRTVSMSVCMLLISQLSFVWQKTPNCDCSVSLQATQ